MQKKAHVLQHEEDEEKREGRRDEAQPNAVPGGGKAADGRKGDGDVDAEPLEKRQYYQIANAAMDVGIVYQFKFRNRFRIANSVFINFNLNMSTVTITAADINKLRQMTGAGMMDCRKA